MRKAMVSLLAAAAILYAGFLGLLFAQQRSIVFAGTAIVAAPEPPSAPGMERLRIASGGAEVDALFLPAHGGAAGVPHPLALLAHGNFELVDHWTQEVESFRVRGIGVLLVEYPGYGRSGGQPSEAAIRDALAAAYDRIAADPRVDPARIFGFGQSLGGGAICALARERPLRALILQSTFTSLAMFTARYFAPAFLLRDRFDNLATVRDFAGPVLVIHGNADPVIPLAAAQRLAAASPRALLKVYDCGHMCWDPARLPFWQDAEPFLKQAGILQ